MQVSLLGKRMRGIPFSQTHFLLTHYLEALWNRRFVIKQVLGLFASSLVVQSQN